MPNLGISNDRRSPFKRVGPLFHSIRIWVLTSPGWITYKAGGIVGSAMLQPFLVDRGMQLSEIGWMLGTVGFSAGLGGAVVGGLVLNLIGRTKSIVVFGLIHMLGVGLYALSAAGLGTEGWLYGFCACEYFAGSLAFVALFTQLMDRSRMEASATDPGIYLLPPGLAIFVQHYPGITLELEIANSQRVVDAVLTRQWDVGMIRIPFEHPHLHVHSYWRDTVILIVAPHHCLASRSTVTLADLSDGTWIFREAGSASGQVVKDVLNGAHLGQAHILFCKTAKSSSRRSWQDSGLPWCRALPSPSKSSRASCGSFPSSTSSRNATSV